MQKTIKDRIHWLLKQKGMTVKSLAKETDINYTTLRAALKKKKDEINSKFCVAIANYFDVPLDWLLTGNDKVLRKRGYSKGIPSSNELREGSEEYRPFTKEDFELLKLLKDEGIESAKDFKEIMEYVRTIKDALHISEVAEIFKSLQLALKKFYVDIKPGK
ncbi:helix-turn-helix transcriptional regulator [candidate division WOR-3 bacterium]|nr:helix-turn-helix transcriptional regulator [candidate division WOR-3 bacterium]